MNRLVSSIASFLVIGALMGMSMTTSWSQELSAQESLMIGNTGTRAPWQSASDDVTSTWDDAHDISDEIVTGSIPDTRSTAAFELPGPLSLMRDGDDDDSRIRGLTIRPGRRVSLEATGSVGDKIGDMGGKFSLRFSF